VDQWPDAKVSYRDLPDEEKRKRFVTIISPVKGYVNAPSFGERSRDGVY
jgi:hypothetical protein